VDPASAAAGAQSPRITAASPRAHASLAGDPSESRRLQRRPFQSFGIPLQMSCSATATSAPRSSAPTKDGAVTLDTDGTSIDLHTFTGRMLSLHKRPRKHEKRARHARVSTRLPEDVETLSTALLGAALRCIAPWGQDCRNIYARRYESRNSTR